MKAKRQAIVASGPLDRRGDMKDLSWVSQVGSWSTLQAYAARTIQNNPVIQNNPSHKDSLTLKSFIVHISPWVYSSM